MDEFTISAIERYPDTFQRVNVSYEYYDLALRFDPNFGADARHHLRFRAGRIWLWHPGVGWYSESHCSTRWERSSSRMRCPGNKAVRARPVLTHEEPSEISVNSMIGLRYKRAAERG